MDYSNPTNPPVKETITKKSRNFCIKNKVFLLKLTESIGTITRKVLDYWKVLSNLFPDEGEYVLQEKFQKKDVI